jgi:UDP-glucuronate decarboxylase
MESPEEVTGPINLGNPGEFTILELAEKVIALTGSSSRIVFKPLPENDPLQRQPDITRAERILGWRPTVPLEEGLKRAIPYFARLIEEKRA